MERLIRGCFYGSVFGDVCGAPFELQAGISLNRALDFFNGWISKGNSLLLEYRHPSFQTSSCSLIYCF